MEFRFRSCLRLRPLGPSGLPVLVLNLGRALNLLSISPTSNWGLLTGTGQGPSCVHGTMASRRLVREESEPRAEDCTFEDTTLGQHLQELVGRAEGAIQRQTELLDDGGDVPTVAALIASVGEGIPPAEGTGVMLDSGIVSKTAPCLGEAIESSSAGAPSSLRTATENIGPEWHRGTIEVSVEAVSEVSYHTLVSQSAVGTVPSGTKPW